MRTGFGIAPVNKLVSLTRLLWALRSFRGFTLHYITCIHVCWTPARSQRWGTCPAPEVSALSPRLVPQQHIIVPQHDCSVFVKLHNYVGPKDTVFVT